MKQGDQSNFEWLSNSANGHLSRRDLLRSAFELGLIASLKPFFPFYAFADVGSPERRGLAAGDTRNTVYELAIRKPPFQVGERTAPSVMINGTIPGPLLRFQEGGSATMKVTNHLDETTSIHWHGLLLPPEMDGVPGVSFAGIKPGETFTYRFPLKQSGTYWYHSHSGGQEQMGMYGPLIIDPIQPDALQYDREYVILLSDWTDVHPMTILKKLKNDVSYFNYQRRTVGEFFSDAKKVGLGATISERLEWAKMRMDPTDLLDVTASTYSYLMNGLPASANWTGLFKKGERIRLRFIDAAADTIFDVRIPGLKLTVAQADGQNVKPVTVDEFRISPGETYDVLVEVKDEKAYTVFAESSDRSGFVLGTLAPRQGMRGEMPERRKRVARTMADMGMSMEMNGGRGGHGGMKMDDSSQENIPGMDQSSSKEPSPEKDQEKKKGSPHDNMPGMDMPGMNMNMGSPSPKSKSPVPGSKPVPHGKDSHGVGNSTTPMETKSRLHEPGIGLGNDDRRVLVYTDLEAATPNEDQREPEREVELHLTGNMERFIWGINGKKYSEDPAPIPFRYGERLRLTFVNDTMMEHPMHLHGMFMYLENGQGKSLPAKHTILVKPSERVSLAVTADAPGDWAFHCHMFYHMEAGMFRVVRVLPKPKDESGGQKS